MMISNEGVYAETPVPASSNDSRKMRTNVGRLQLNTDHPSRKTSFDSADMEYSLRRKAFDEYEADDENTNEVESEAVHVTHSVLKPQENIKKAPEQRTYT